MSYLPGFFSLSSAWLFALLIPLIIFYFLKLRRPRMEIPSLALWRSVLQDQRVNSPFQKFKRNILLFLQIALLILLCTAAMQPFLRAAPQRARYLPVLIDVSASMAAKNESGGLTRLDAAKEQVRKLIDNLLPDQQVSLIAFHNSPQRLTDFTDNRQVLRDALDRLKPVDLPSKIDDALRLAQAMTRTVPVDTVMMITDGNVPDAVDFDLPFELKVQLVGPAGPNVGITALNARRSGPGKWDVFARIESAVNGAPSADAEWFQDGQSLTTSRISLEAGRAQRLKVTVRGGPPTRLELRLKPVDFDALPTDNSAWLDLPAIRPLAIYCDMDLGVYRHALKGLKDIDVYPRDDGQGAAVRYDLVISDKAADLQKDAPTGFFVGFIPPDLDKLIDVRPKVGTVVDWARSSTLLQHVQLADVQAAEEPYSLENVRDEQFEQLGYEVLIDGRSGPLLLQKRMGPKQTFHLLFHSDKSTLPYRVGFPVLVANLANVAFTQASLTEVRAAPTGLFPPNKFRENTAYRVTLPNKTSVQAKSNREAVLMGVGAPIVGDYVVSDGSREAGRVGISLVNSRETTLAGLPLDRRGQPLLQFRETSVAADTAPVENDRPLWQLFALLAFALLVIEWWFFQKRPM